jgi:hypothetical protein
LKIQNVNRSYDRLLTRLPFGLIDSAAPPSAKSCPYMLLPLLFLLSVWPELSSTDANVSSNSNNIEGQLSFKCKKAWDCITAAQSIISIKEYSEVENSKSMIRKGIKSKGINSLRVCSEQNLNLNNKSQKTQKILSLNSKKTFIPTNLQKFKKWLVDK